ncbi:cytochrome o ubiquinol oxidase subunit III, partial [Paenibacillus larvae]|nr:cytochrome o ubiquinol oxidase subunit III [Paenibacillus larvae]
MEIAHGHDKSNSGAPLEYQSETGRLNILGFWI